MEGEMRRTLETNMKSSSMASGTPGPDEQASRSNLMEQFYFSRPAQSFPGFPPFFGAPSSSLYLPNDNEAKVGNQFESNPSVNNRLTDWDPQAMVSNLSFLEQKIKQVKHIVLSMSSRENQVAGGSCELAARQQLITADLTSIIIQLVSTAGSLLPSMKNPLLSSNPAVRQLGSTLGSPMGFGMNANQQPSTSSKNAIPDIDKTSDYEEMMNSLNAKQDERDEVIKCPNPCGGEGSDPTPMEDHDVKESDDGGEGENLPPGSYVVLQLEKEEILAPHTHFCLICGKGFKRDANLRMHMRGHGDEYKTPAALAKPTKDSSSDHAPVTRYSCPFVGCKRNKEHKKFQPLKTILCVKNHYKRSHCDKSYTCSRCNTKKFSVIADLKTHEKHCGRDKWLCSCGTTFSRKDKLFGHVALFQGHTPALPMDDVKVSEASEQPQSSEAVNEISRSTGYDIPCTSSDGISNLDMKVADDARGYFSPLNFDPCFGALDDFTRPGFDISESPFSFLPSGPYSFGQQNGTADGEWHPYFSSPDIGLFKTTLKGASWEVEKLALQVAPSVVGLQSKVGETDHFFCSGTVVESDKGTHTIVTIANLVRSPDTDDVASHLKINVYLHNNETCEGELLYHDFYHNICFIRIHTPVHLLEKDFTSNIEAMHFGKSSSREVVTLGRDKETHILVVSTGKIIPRCSKFECEELLVSTCRISKAEVEGPLMNFDGDLIGMNYYHKNETPFIPSFIVLKCLHQFTSFRKVVRPSHGLRVRTLYAEGCDALKKMQINFCRATGVIIEKIEEQSPAKASGLNEGDIINRVNGVCFSSAVEFGGLLLDVGARSRYLSEHRTLEQLDDSNTMAIPIKFGVMGCENEKTIVVDKFTSGGLNRWPFPKPIIVHKYRKGKKVLEERYSMES